MILEMAEQVHPDGRDRSGDGHPLLLDQPGDRLGLHEARGHDQIRAHQAGRVGDAPGVGVEHRNDGQHAVGGAQSHGITQAGGQGMQQVGPVGVEHSLGVTGRPARVAEPRGLAIVELGVGEPGLRIGDQLLVAQGAGERAGVAVAHDHVVAHRLQPRSHSFEKLDQRRVDEHDAVLGVVGHVDELILEQADVQRVQDGSHARRGQVDLEMVLGVPGEGGDPVAGLDPQIGESAADPIDPIGHLGVGGALHALVAEGDHLAVAEHPPHAVEYVLDGQRVVVLDESLEHWRPSRASAPTHARRRRAALWADPTVPDRRVT